MGARGGLIMGVFGALFVALSTNWYRHASGLALVPPFAMFAVIALAAVLVMRLPGDGVIPDGYARKIIKWSSIGEGIGLVVGSNLVILSNRLDLMLPVMALVVGLHFLPMGLMIGFPPFLIVGAAMILSAIIGFAIPAPSGGEIAGFGSGAILWAAAVLAIRRDWLARRSIRPS